MGHDSIAIVDFGGMFAHLIATKVRRLKVLAEIRQPDDPVEAFQGFKGVILAGGPGESQGFNKAIFGLDVPILGCGFGHLEMARFYGGSVGPSTLSWGHSDLKIVADHPLVNGFVGPVWSSQRDVVTSVGPEFAKLAATVCKNGDLLPFTAVASDKLRRYGVQFHPEVDETVDGGKLIANFVLAICGCKPSWTMETYLEQQIAAIRQQVGDQSVFLLASGGVDSTVAAVLLRKALGPDRLHLLHVDNGMMRKNESANVLDMFRRFDMDHNLHFVDATDIFLTALGDEVEPEKKRKIIGNTFISEFERIAKELGIERHLLGQGTIYPDTVETGANKGAQTIKTHHNRVPVIDQMIAQGRVVEPLADLYKIEVRELGELLGIDRKLLWRHPFPGPGLGVRLLCSDGKVDVNEIAAIQQEVDRFIAKKGILNMQFLALPIKSVGVKGDRRSYEHPVMISGGDNWDEVANLADELLKTVPGVNRCIWNLGSHAPKSVELLLATMTKARLDLLREADHIVMDGLKRHGQYDDIWQCPTALVPMKINNAGQELCIVRPIHSERAMTATAASLPPALLKELADKILALPGISGLTLDLTSKPPGTIEWE